MDLILVLGREVFVVGGAWGGVGEQGDLNFSLPDLLPSTFTSPLVASTSVLFCFQIIMQRCKIFLNSISMLRAASVVLFDTFDCHVQPPINSKTTFIYVMF